MQRDSRRISGKSGQLTANHHVVPRQTQVQSYQCSHCVLIFTSKLVLLEHLGKVHDLGLCDGLRQATALPVDNAGQQHMKPKNDHPGDNCASALQPEENKPDVLSKLNASKQVAVEKGNSRIAEPTSKDKVVTDLAGPKRSRKITPYLTASSVPNVKSPSFRVTSPDKKQAANTAKKTLISRKSGPASYQSNDCGSIKSYCLPSELNIQLPPDRTKRVLDNYVTPSPKKPKLGLIKIELPTFPPRKSHFPDSSRLMLEFSDSEEDHKLPKEEINQEEHHGNADISPAKQMEANPSKRNPTSNAVQAELYKCDACTFGHKSVVAMLVHYQKQHPTLGVTLKQIKQSRCFVADQKPLVLPETSSEFLSMDAPNQDDKPMASSDNNASSEKTKDKSKLTTEENVSAVNPKDVPDTPQKQHKVSTDAGSPSSVCNDSNPTLILSHQKNQRGIVNSSPREVKPPDATERGEAEKSPMVFRTRISKKLPTSGPLAGDCKQKKPVEDQLSHGKRVEKLFFCPECNYANCFLKAVLIHCRKKHKQKSRKTTANTISIHTASIRRRMKKSQNNNVPALSSGLPLPILQGEKDMFFCHLCNYRHNLLRRILDHQKVSHPEIGKAKKQVLAYTAEVYERPCEEQLKCEANQIVSVAPASPLQSEIENVQTSLPGNSIPVSKMTEMKKTHPYICHKCAYTASSVYLIKRHLSRRHLIHQTTAITLRKAFDKGFIKEGYYCQWCCFSDKKAAGVYEHCKEMHRSKHNSLTHIINHLHVAPKDATSKTPNDIGSPTPSQGSGSKDPKTYSCQICSFKGSSYKGIINHNSKVHPGSVREKGSVFVGISSGDDDEISHALEADGHHEVPASLDNSIPASQAPQELEPSPSLSPLDTPSSESYMCHFCSALFTTRHGLKIHYGMKHIDKWQSEELHFDDHAVTPSDMVSALIYKCPWCRYVHTTEQGVLTHCLKKHSTKKVRAQGLESVEALVPQGCNGKQTTLSHHSGRHRIGGYLCQLCKEVHHSVAKFKMHFKNRHSNSVPSVLKPAKYAIAKQLLSKYYGAQGSGLQKSSLIKNQPGLMKCSFCKYVSKSKNAFNNHVKVCMENKKMRHVFKCSSCSYVTLTGRYLRKHYRARHGTQVNAPAMEYTDVGYNCRLCPYVSSKSMYLVSHYTKAHGIEAPEVFQNNSIQCRKCNKLMFFSSYNRLSIHYTSFHRTHFKMDFKVLLSKKSAVAGYKCQHCSLKLETIKELCCHLQNHQEQKTKTVKKSCVAVTTSIQCDEKGLSPKLQTSPNPEAEGEARGAKAQACKHCGRSFTSLVGLRVHERSHEAVAALQDTGPVAWSEDVFDSFTRFRPGTLKPFQCRICGYRTSLMGLLKSHIMKKHLDELPDTNAGPSASVVEEESSPKVADDPPAAPPDPQKDNSFSPPRTTETSKHSVYSEPAEVQRQLSHYRSMPLANTLALSAPEVPKLPGDKLLYCEFCDFSSEHQSSLRRHYVNIHGKKLLRCKDCSFFTGIRKTLDLHKEMGHSSCQMEPTHKKTLRCPLCLYHTKNQNHMIDHIVLHRQERVVPIEVRRPKLSRYLKGIVFRCHQCTFTSGNASNLRTHVLKHDNVRPYQCRLCYFDCTRLSELEAHLCDKHQVVRNHEMVGQVNLDHLEMRAGHEPEGDEEGDEEDGGSNPREGNDEDKEVETDGCDDVRQQEKRTERDVRANNAPAPLHRESSGGLAGHAQRADDEVGSAGSKEEAARRPRRRCDAGPAAEPAVLSSKRFRGAGFGSDPRGKAESTVEEDGQNYKSSPDTETQKPITAAGGQLFAATHVTNCVTRTVDVKLLEKPLLSLEDEQAYGRKCDDGLGSPEMPVLENVYLNNQRNPTATRQDATGDSRRGDTRERRETPDEIPGEGPVNECLVRDLEAAKGTEEAGTLSSKGAAPEGPAGVARRSSQADGVLSCSLCGRLFSNGAKLQHHVKRHGM